MPVTSFPNIAVSEKEKQNSDYYKQWVEAVCGYNFTPNWVNNYNEQALLQNFFLEGTSSNLTGFLQSAPDGSQMPGIWTSISNIRTRVKALVGELEERGYRISARAMNPEAETRKLKERDRLRRKRRLQGLREFVDQRAGIALEKNEYVPQTDEELKEYMDLSWKDVNVQIIESALKWIAQRSQWDEKRKRGFLYNIINNVTAARNEIVRGVPTPRIVDPLKFIFDPNSTDDNLSDSTYFGEIEYLPLATVAERYDISLKELQEVYNTYSSWLGMGSGSGYTGEAYSFGCIPNNCLKWFRIEDGTPRCLVVKAVWKDYKTLSTKYEENEEKGSVHLQDMTYADKIKKRDEDKITHKRLECWRQGTLIGGRFLKEWGECPNQPRSLNSLEIAECPYIVWVPEFLNGKFTSLVKQQVGLAVLKDIAMYQLQIQMARAIGKVLIYDQAMIPEGQTYEQVVSRMKADGVVFVNSREYQTGVGNMNLFKDVDIGLSDSINQGVALIEYLDRQLDQVSGVNQERQGQTQGASQAVGTMNAALFQSNLITAPMFKGFERWCSRVHTNQAKLVRIAWAGKEVFAPIIGEVGVDFITQNIDISMDEMDIIVESLPPSPQQRQTLTNILNIIVQGDPSFAPEALNILIEPDTTIAIRRFNRVMALRQIAMSQQEQQTQQQQMQMAQQQMQLEQQNAQADRENQLQLQGMKNQGNIQKTAMTGRVKLTSQKIDLLKI